MTTSPVPCISMLVCIKFSKGKNVHDEVAISEFQSSSVENEVERTNKIQGSDLELHVVV